MRARNSTADHHSVGRVRCAIETHSTAEAAAASDLVSDFVHRHLGRILEETIEQAGIREHVYIEKLEVDLGDLPIGALEEVASERVAAALRRSLKNELSAPRHSARGHGAQDREDRVFNRLTFSLTSGRYPEWPGPMAEGLVPLMERGARANPARLNATLSRLLVQPFAAERLELSLTDAAVERLVRAAGGPATRQGRGLGKLLSSVTHDGPRATAGSAKEATGAFEMEVLFKKSAETSASGPRPESNDVSKREGMEPSPDRVQPIVARTDRSRPKVAKPGPSNTPVHHEPAQAPTREEPAQNHDAAPPEGLTRGDRPEGLTRGERPEGLTRGERPVGLTRGERPESLTRGERAMLHAGAPSAANPVPRGLHAVPPKSAAGAAPRKETYPQERHGGPRRAPSSTQTPALAVILAGLTGAADAALADRLAALPLQDLFVSAEPSALEALHRRLHPDVLLGAAFHLAPPARARLVAGARARLNEAALALEAHARKEQALAALIARTETTQPHGPRARLDPLLTWCRFGPQWDGAPKPATLIEPLVILLNDTAPQTTEIRGILARRPLARAHMTRLIFDHLTPAQRETVFIAADIVPPLAGRLARCAKPLPAPRLRWFDAVATSFLNTRPSASSASELLHDLAERAEISLPHLLGRLALSERFLAEDGGSEDGGARPGLALVPAPEAHLARTVEAALKAEVPAAPAAVAQAFVSANEAYPLDVLESQSAGFGQVARTLGVAPEDLRGGHASEPHTPAPNALPPIVPPNPVKISAVKDASTAMAGLCLLGPVLPRYFAAAGTTQEDQFVGPDARERSVYLLALLATGRTDWPETALTLCKLLCGLPEAAPLGAAHQPEENDKDQAEGLLTYFATVVPSLRETDVAGLRRTFLARHGVIRATDGQASVTVPKGPYDVLLKSVPWPISHVSLPWLADPLRVEWL